MSDLPTTAHAALRPHIVEIYYDGLKTKHSFAVLPSNNFFFLKLILSQKNYANIPIENQKLIYCGLVPKDTDTMAMHKVGTGGFRIALVRVKSPAQIAKQEEEGREKRTRGGYLQETRDAMLRLLRDNSIERIRADQAMLYQEALYQEFEDSTHML